MVRQAARPTSGTVLQHLPIGIALTLLAAVPSFFNLATEQIFEEQKSLLLRGAALVAVPGVVALWRADWRRQLRHPIVLVFLALVITFAISTILAGAGRDAVLGAYLRRHGLVTWIALAVLFASMLPAARTASGREMVMLAIAIGACWPSAHLLLQRAGLDSVNWVVPAASYESGGSFGNRVMLGGYLALAIPLTVSLGLRVHPAWCLAAALQVIALVVSGSRGAALALTAAGIVGVGVVLWRRAPRRMAIGATVAAALAVLTIALFPPAALAERLNPQTGSARVRILIWNDTLDILRASGPRLALGHGLESLRSLFPSHYSPELGVREQNDAIPDRAHNETLDTLVTGGLVGTVTQLALFAMVLIGALRIGDVWLEAGLAAAVIAHVVEIQFGIASVSARLSFLAIAAMVAGASLSGEEPARVNRSRYLWLLSAALLGAASPWLSTLPARWNSAPTSGTEAQFVDYLAQLSRSTPALYAGFLGIALLLARSVAVYRRPAPAAGWQVIAIVMASWLVVPLSIVPSRADAFAAAGASYEREQRWQESAIAYGAAVREAPYVPDYHANFARASIEWAIRNEPARRDQLLTQARESYDRAVALDASDPTHLRHLLAWHRISASQSQGEAREKALSEADQIGARLTAWAPTLTPVWVEWAWVDVDRGRRNDAIAKLDKALALDPQRSDAQQLRADLLAQRGSLEAK